MEGSREGSNSSLTELSGMSTGRTLHGEEIDTVLTVTVVTQQRSGISVALQAYSTRELRVQLILNASLLKAGIAAQEVE